MTLGIAGLAAFPLGGLFSSAEPGKRLGEIEVFSKGDPDSRYELNLDESLAIDAVGRVSLGLGRLAEPDYEVAATFVVTEPPVAFGIFVGWVHGSAQFITISSGSSTTCNRDRLVKSHNNLPLWDHLKDTKLPAAIANSRVHIGVGIRDSQISRVAINGHEALELVRPNVWSYGDTEFCRGDFGVTVVNGSIVVNDLFVTSQAQRIEVRMSRKET